MILLSTTTNAQDVLRDIKIKKNDKAKFDGVLVPEYHYRDYSKAFELQPLCEKKISEIASEHTTLDDVIVFGLGMLGGVLIYNAIRK